MYVESIELNNFRNYEHLKLNFDKGVNVFYGDNAQGKTNLLEAVFFSGTTKSYRNCKDRDMISFGCNEAHIKTLIRKNEKQYKIDFHLKDNKNKGIAINGIPIKKASELFGICNFIFFSPEDLNIIKNGPSMRRRFLDMEIGQIDSIYLHNLVMYKKVLNQRNVLLKEMSFNNNYDGVIDVLDEQLVKYGSSLIDIREKFTNELKEILKEVHSRMTCGRENLSIKYEPSVESDKFKEKLKASFEKDKKFKNTDIGPHKDDLCFMIDGIDIRHFGSQGQQRTSALSLKLSEIKMIRKKTDDIPVLLLDDVLSELDKNRQQNLLDSIKDIQTMITCTGLEDFIKHGFLADRFYHVENGIINEEEK